jgi:hypothetical protein
MTPAIDPGYDRLLHKIQPGPPRNKDENKRLLAEIGTDAERLAQPHSRGSRHARSAGHSDRRVLRRPKCSAS